MWHFSTGSNNTKRTLRILVVTSVTLCLFVIYIKRSNNISSLNDFYPISRNVTSVLSYTKENSTSANDNLSSGNALATLSKKSTSIKDDSNKGNTFQTVLKSKPELNEIDSLENTTLIQVTNLTEIEQSLNWTNIYSTEDPVSKEQPLQGVQIHSGNRDEVHTKVTLFPRKTGSNGIVNWNKFKHLPFRRQKSGRSMLTTLPYFQTFDKAAYDIMDMDTIDFDPAFKNPCWRGREYFSPLNDEKLHCLPYFYIMGVKKSGTTDFYSRMRRHPEFCRPSFAKESQWFARLRFGIKAFSLNNNRLQILIHRGLDPRKVEFFVTLFDNAARCISHHPSRDRNDSLHYKMVTAEASPSTFHMHTNWEQLPGNEKLAEPRYTNFHYIKHITPNAKIIMLFRDPTTRLYSDFLHTTHGKYGRSSPEVFHRHVTEMIKTYKRCFSQFSRRSCVYNNALKQKLRSKRVDLAESFNAGFYAVFMRDLLAVFERDQLLPILMTDYITNMGETLRNAFSFLDMSAVSPTTMRRMLKMGKQNVSKKKKKIGAMLDETRDMLYDFYQPYNEDMAALMNDTRYLFPKT